MGFYLRLSEWSNIKGEKERGREETSVINTLRTLFIGTNVAEIRDLYRSQE